MRSLAFVIAGALALAACSGPGPDQGEDQSVRTPDAAPHADEGPGAYIVNLKDGDVVSSPFRVVFGLYGMGVAPAGTDRPNTGHHHLLIDSTLEGDDLNYAIPADENHIHFGGGQTETVLDLPPGEHSLQLVLGDMNHVPFNPSIQSERITITVR